jgi:hypothetical protein
MSTIARNGSSLTLRMAFQPAWSAAAARTARKTLTEMEEALGNDADPWVARKE